MLLPQDTRSCADCGNNYKLTLAKPGKVNQCHQCGSRSETMARVGGNMVYTGKQAPEIEIKPMADARRFNNKTRRLGAGVTASLVTRKKEAEQDLFRHGQWMKDEPLGD
jgi:DNA-directed RNA polymerase subunit RPC12/RpoP